LTADLLGLSSCDLEPIHIPASIQAHGVLLVLREPDLIVTQASENVQQYFGRSLDSVLGSSIATIFDCSDIQKIQEAVASGDWTSVNPLRLTGADTQYDGIVHRHEGALILELEATSTAAHQESKHHPLRAALISLQSVRTQRSLCDTVVTEIRRLTGFERVVLYRFHADGVGSVDAESKESHLEPFLNLHYPASDIPQQARELYLKNWLRIIPNQGYAPVAIVPPMRADTGRPLDLSHSVLRSVSPVHLEYMGNMGVRASMSVSLIVRDRLWGLISCANHSSTRVIPYELRSACEIVGRLASLQLSAVQDNEAQMARESRRSERDELAWALKKGEVLEGALASPDALMRLVSAEGAAVVRGLDVRTCGTTPPTKAITALSEWLDERSAVGPFETSCLTLTYPAGTQIADVGSGILTFSLPGTPGRRIIWFRPEVQKRVEWGGDPLQSKLIDPRMRLHPRRSFEMWKEEVRLHSDAWTTPDLEAAEEFRRDAVEIDLERQVVRERLAVRARDDLVAEVSHDLRSPLGVIQMQAAILMQTVATERADISRRIQTSAEHIQRAVRKMNTLIRDLLDLAKLEAGRFTLQCERYRMSHLIEESLLILRPLADAKQIRLTSDLQGGEVSADRERIFQVLANLVGNAIKFTPEQGSIFVRSETRDQEIRVTVSDNGPGVPADQVLNLFDRYWQARPNDREGSGLGLFIAKGIVEAHGGRIWIEPDTGVGASFVFTLPGIEGAAGDQKSSNRIEPRFF
jgi:chemotaxis family two-component system sensor kinase Cph1